MCRQFLLRSKLGDLEWGNRREQNREEGKGSPGVHLGAGYHCGQAGQYPRGSFWGTVAKTWERGVLPMGLCLCWSKCALGSADSGTPAGLCMCACVPVWTCTCVSTAGLLPAGGGGGRRWGGERPGGRTQREGSTGEKSGSRLQWSTGVATVAAGGTGDLGPCEPGSQTCPP